EFPIAQAVARVEQGSQLRIFTSSRRPSQRMLTKSKWKPNLYEIYFMEGIEMVKDMVMDSLRGEWRVA
ncbi:hypothetical protein HAX54_013964, partial [Datura stramonium]|nr:hypothetical protein [Datura stramonium]